MNKLFEFMMNGLNKVVFLLLAIMVLASCNANKTKDDKQDIKWTEHNVSEEDTYKNTALEEAYHQLSSGQNLSDDDIQKFAADIETRADFYGLLVSFNKEELFPQAYNNFEKAGESILANWLEYPTELDTIPSAITFVKKVRIVQEGISYTYYVFQFKTEEPHWAAKDGWMMGVVGPYSDDAKPYDWTGGTFSEFNKSKETTPEKEAEWSQKNVYEKNPSVQ